MRKAHARPGPSATGRLALVDPMRIDPSGITGPTPAQTRGSAWRRSSHGLFVPSDVDDGVPEQRIVEAAAVLPDYGGVTGWAALRWLGGTWFDGLEPDAATRRPVWLVTMCCDIRDQPGIRVSGERLNPADLTTVDNLRVTTAVRSVVFEMRYAASVRDAVVKADMAMRDDLVSTDELWAYALTHPGWTGIPQCRSALLLTNENSWSPMETLRLRLPWVLDAGLPPPLCNRPIFDMDGRHIGTPDILDEEAGVAGEYDGAMHLPGLRRADDLRREDAFRRAGLEYFTVVAGDARDPARVVRRMVETRARARFESPARRTWTTEHPPWWVPTETVAERRALTASQYARIFRNRAG
jgi:hypothetical protein